MLRIACCQRRIDTGPVSMQSAARQIHGVLFCEWVAKAVDHVRLMSLVVLVAYVACRSGTATVARAAEETKPPVLSAVNVHLRDSLNNSRIQFLTQKKGCVAFMGGSITEMAGYRPMVCQNLKRRFPNTQFTFISAGIASTCSTTGAFRIERDVLNHGPIDLLFVEFAVNDDQDAGHSRIECIRGMEGIVRHLWKRYPCADIVMIHFVNPSMLESLQAGQTPLTAASHERVAEYYGISTIDLQREVAQRIAANTLTWQQYGGTHPKPFGNAICASMIEHLFDLAEKQPVESSARPVAHPLPAKPLDPGNYENGHFVDPGGAEIQHDWKLLVPDWKRIPGMLRSRFEKTRLLCADEPGATLTLRFSGQAVGAYVLAGPDAGIVETSVDGAAFHETDLFHRFSRNLHYPRTVMFDTDLPVGKHTLTMRLTTKHHRDSQGTAVRILQFAVN